MNRSIHVRLEAVQKMGPVCSSITKGCLRITSLTPSVVSTCPFSGNTMNRNESRHAQHHPLGVEQLPFDSGDSPRGLCVGVDPFIYLILISSARCRQVPILSGQRDPTCSSSKPVVHREKRRFMSTRNLKHFVRHPMIAHQRLIRRNAVCGANLGG
jgi:hypothetical protein